jgi:hypothetical protein
MGSLERSPMRWDSCRALVGCSAPSRAAWLPPPGPALLPPPGVVRPAPRPVLRTHACARGEGSRRAQREARDLHARARCRLIPAPTRTGQLHGLPARAACTAARAACTAARAACTGRLHGCTGRSGPAGTTHAGGRPPRSRAPLVAGATRVPGAARRPRRNRGGALRARLPALAAAGPRKKEGSRSPRLRYEGEKNARPSATRAEAPERRRCERWCIQRQR